MPFKVLTKYVGQWLLVWGELRKVWFCETKLSPAMQHSVPGHTNSTEHTVTRYCLQSHITLAPPRVQSSEGQRVHFEVNLVEVLARCIHVKY